MGKLDETRLGNIQIMHRMALTLCLFFASPAMASADCPEGQRQIEHLAGTTCVVKQPQRIVTLHSLSLSISVYELGGGDRLVGEFGWAPDGEELLVQPTTRYHTSLAYEDGRFEGIGWMDFEKIASLEPDLILGRDWELDYFDQLSAIAPTVMIDVHTSIPEISAQVAEAIGERDAQKQLHARFLDRAAEVKAALVMPQNIDVAFVTSIDFDDLLVAQRFHALSGAMDHLGITPAPAVVEFLEQVFGEGTRRHRAPISLERIEVIDADLLLLPYWVNSIDQNARLDDFDHQDGVSLVKDRMEDLIPGYCAFLKVCQAGQTIIFEGTPTYTPTYSGLMAGLDFIEDEIVGHDIKQIVLDLDFLGNFCAD